MIRPTAPADAEVIAFHRYPGDTDAGERPLYAAWVATALQRGTYLGFLTVTDGGEVVSGAGLALLEWGPTRGDPQPWRARVVNVWTHPDWRRRGLARELVTHCLDAARAQGITRLSLGTSELGRALYEALGFRPSETEMVWVAPD